MAMRLSGLMSGMDTESIVSQLVEARKTKVTKAVKAQKSLKYKQDAWKTLNTQILKLYNNALSNMRFEANFVKKTTKVSDSSVVSVITGEGAMNSVQTLEVNELAKSGYLTGGELKLAEGASSKKITGDTTLSDLGFDVAGKGSIEIETIDENGETVKTPIIVDGSTTISSFVGGLRNAGLNANFDENNGRLYISAKTSGEKNDFKINVLENGDKVLNVLKLDANSGAQRVKGQDAEITLNGAKYTSSTNSFNVNGLTLTVNAETDKPVTITTQDDTDGIYDMIKNFFKEYNSLINQMDKLYNADSAKGYEPLTDEEKEAMPDSAIEEWENKIKDSILRKDSSLSSISSEMKRIMMEGVSMQSMQIGEDANGQPIYQKMYLSNFGINTLGYFIAPENEKNAYHIDGDSDDSETSGNADKLKTMIANDPDTVVEFFTGLAKNLYGRMTELMGTTDYSSMYSAYDDKKMQSEYDDYTVKIKELENKLADYEDKWYAKFAAMETALAKMQNNASAVTALLGG